MVKAEGQCLAVPLLLRAFPETQECQGCLEASHPEVQWEVQWGHPVVRFPGRP